MKTHGMSKTREYHVWFNMMDRCYNPANRAYVNYGGRGITVCDRWHIFENFYADMCPRPTRLTLDRKDNLLGYSKENCHWVTMKTQQRNRRDNKVVTFNEVSRPLSEWVEIFGLKYDTTLKRLKAGWSIDRAFNDSRKYRMLTLDGETLPMAAWSKRIGISMGALGKRLDKYHWSVERALTEPKQR